VKNGPGRDECPREPQVFRRGDDADTTGAVCGQIAGAMWGESGVPEEWLEGAGRARYRRLHPGEAVDATQ